MAMTNTFRRMHTSCHDDLHGNIIKNRTENGLFAASPPPRVTA
jgi:hypothetical protein